ncbi:MAG: hypothetical protein WBP41_12955 [Saprospiraceae bacterium]
MKAIGITICILTITMLFAHQQRTSTIIQQDKGYLLDSIFPIDNIVNIKVTNFSGTHTLTAKELTILKEQLKQAKYAGGLLIKPGHITVSISLKDDTIAKTGFVYGSTGCIHFDGGIDKFNHHINGTFYLPTQLNFDNYK